MAIKCTYKSSRGLELPNAYCKITSLGLTEHSEVEGSRYAFITVGVWASKEQRETNPTPITVEQFRVANGYVSQGIGTEETLDNAYDRVFGSDVLSGNGVNPVTAAYDYVKQLSAFNTDQTNV